MRGVVLSSGVQSTPRPWAFSPGAPGQGENFVKISLSDESEDDPAQPHDAARRVCGGCILDPRKMYVDKCG